MVTTNMSLHTAVNNMGKRLTFQLIIALRIAVSALVERASIMYVQNEVNSAIT